MEPQSQILATDNMVKEFDTTVQAAVRQVSSIIAAAMDGIQTLTVVTGRDRRCSEMLLASVYNYVCVCVSVSL